MVRPAVLLGSALAVACILALPSSAQNQGSTGTLPARQARMSRDALSPEFMAVCLQVARDVDPDLAKRLETIRATRSEVDLARAMRNARHLIGLARLKEEDPKLYDVKVKTLKLDARVDRLVRRYIEAQDASASTSVVEDLEQQLNTLVTEQVAYSLAARGMYLSRLNEHVQTLRDRLGHDVQHFNAAVEQRLQELLDEAAARAAFNNP